MFVVFAIVAVLTCKSQILHGVRTLFGYWNDVIHTKRMECELAQCQTVFTYMIGSIPDELTKFSRYHEVNFDLNPSPVGQPFALM